MTYRIIFSQRGKMLIIDLMDLFIEKIETVVIVMPQYGNSSKRI